MKGLMLPPITRWRKKLCDLILGRHRKNIYCRFVINFPILLVFL